MKALPALLILFSFMPIAYAASDCEHTCCDRYNGWWDDDFDDCKSTDDGYDTCVSDCEGAIWANRPPIDTTGGTHYECKVGAILLALTAAVVIIARKA